MNAQHVPDRALIRRIVAEARPYRARLLTLLAIGFLETPVLLLTPLPLKIAVDNVLDGRPLPGFVDALTPSAFTSTPGRLLILAAVLQVLVVTLVGALQLAREVERKRTGEALTLGFRATMFARLQRLSLTFHDDRGPADSLYRVQHDASAIQSFMVDGVLPFVTSAITLVAMFVVTARIDLHLALVALAVSPVMVALARTYKRRLRVRHRRAKELESSALKVVQQSLGELRVVKAFGREDGEHERFMERARDGARARVGLVVAEETLGLLVGGVTAVGTAMVLLIGVNNVRSGRLSTGDLLVVLAYLSQLYSPLKTVSRKIATVQSAMASAERAYEVLDETPDVVDRPDARRVERTRGELRLEGVAFAYGERARVLSGASLHIAAGKRLGIVGETGAGKTTIASLLLRFYEPGDGRILLDGVDIRDIAVEDLRRQFAVVLQEPLLFSASVRENIAYGRPGANDSAIIEAARAAGADRFISRLPNGYDTTIGERGMQLSGGERQRIALARAFLRDAPILILDEPTSALDVHTEVEIMDALGRLMDGRTTLVISHRPTILHRCTAWVQVLDGGFVHLTGPDQLAGATRR